jgi:hypothetical protein
MSYGNFEAPKEMFKTRGNDTRFSRAPTADEVAKLQKELLVQQQLSLPTESRIRKLGTFVNHTTVKPAIGSFKRFSTQWEVQSFNSVSPRKFTSNLRKRPALLTEPQTKAALILETELELEIDQPLNL